MVFFLLAGAALVGIGVALFSHSNEIDKARKEQEVKNTKIQ